MDALVSCQADGQQSMTPLRHKRSISLLPRSSFTDWVPPPQLDSRSEPPSSARRFPGIRGLESLNEPPPPIPCVPQELVSWDLYSGFASLYWRRKALATINGHLSSDVFGVLQTQFTAARDNNCEVLLECLTKGCDAMLADNNGWTLLHWAAAGNAAEAAQVYSFIVGCMKCKGQLKCFVLYKSHNIPGLFAGFCTHSTSLTDLWKFTDPTPERSICRHANYCGSGFQWTCLGGFFSPSCGCKPGISGSCTGRLKNSPCIAILCRMKPSEDIYYFTYYFSKVWYLLEYCLPSMHIKIPFLDELFSFVHHEFIKLSLICSYWPNLLTPQWLHVVGPTAW